MKDLFYLSVIVIVTTLIIYFVPGAYTGNAICDGLCVPMCDVGEDCSLGEVCCPTDLGGVCEIPQNCAVVADYLAEDHTVEDYFIQKENPKIITNIGWDTFWRPLVIISILIVGILYFTKRKPLKN